MPMRFILFLVFASLGIQGVYAQYTIRGVVEDDEGLLLEAATIQLFNINNPIFAGGTTTDAKGRFVLENITRGDYRVLISCLGYKASEIYISDVQKSVDMEVITLSAVTFELQSVVIKGSREIHKDDKMMIYPSADQKKYAANGYGLLNNLLIPTLFVNTTSNVVSSPLGKVSLYINGREVDRKEILALPPGQVLRVEYQDSPGGNFPGKDVVINFVTIKRKSGGYVGLNADQRLVSGEYIVTGKLHHKASEFSLIYSPSYISDKNTYENSVETFNFPEGMVVRNGKGDPSRFNENLHQLNLNYYYRSGRQNLNVTLDYWLYNNPRNEINETQSYVGIYNKVYQSHTASSKKKTEPSINIKYELNITSQHKLDLTLFTDRTKDTYDYTYSENRQQQTESFFWDRDMEGRYWYADLIYWYNPNELNTLLLRGVYSRQNATYTYSNSFVEDQSYDDMAGYVYYRRRWKRFSSTVNAGLSRHSYYSDKEEKSNDWNKELGWFLRYSDGKSNTVNYKIQLSDASPSLEELSTTNLPIDFMQVYRGNPFLKNNTRLMQLASYWLTINKNRFYFSLQQTSYFNITQQNVYLEADEFIHSYISDNDLHSIRFIATSTRNFWNEKLNIRISGNFTHYWINGTPGSRVNAWYAEGSVNYKYKEWLISGYAKTTEHVLDRDGIHYRSGSVYGLSLGYTREGFLFSVGTENPFYNSHSDIKFNSDIYIKKASVFNRTSGKVFFVRAAWNFSFGDKHTYKEVDTKKAKEGIREPF